MSTSTALPLGALVWAKMKGFSPWPGRVERPPANLAKKPRNSKVKCVYFFGSNNFAWIEDANIKDYDAHKEALSSSCKSAPFKEACAAIEEYKLKLSTGEIVHDYTSDDEKLYGKDSSADTSSLFNSPETPVNSGSDTSSAAKQRRGRKKKSVSTEENGDHDSSPDKNRKKLKRESVSKFESKAESSSESEVSTPTGNYVRKNTAVGNLLNRPVSVGRGGEERTLDIGQASQTLKSKQIVPSEMTFGFLGLGIMGSGIARNILQSGHKVVVWNRSPDKCLPFVEQGAQQCQTPSDVVQLADITFSCVSDPYAAKELVFGNCGVLKEINTSKGYVEMTSTDAENSIDISEAILGQGGRYLEAAIQGSRNESEEGTLIIMGAGDRSLYNDCQSCFKAMGTHAFYLGDVGSASKMNIVLQLIRGISVAALAEGLALADRGGLDQQSVMDILNLTSMANKDFKEKGNAIVTANFQPHMSLQHMQKDLNLAIQMSQMYDQPVPLAAATNEIYKHAKRLGYGEHDVSAVYVRARF